MNSKCLVACLWLLGAMQFAYGLPQALTNVSSTAEFISSVTAKPSNGGDKVGTEDPPINSVPPSNKISQQIPPSQSPVVVGPQDNGTLPGPTKPDKNTTQAPPTTTASPTTTAPSPTPGSSTTSPPPKTESTSTSSPTTPTEPPTPTKTSTASTVSTTHASSSTPLIPTSDTPLSTNSPPPTKTPTAAPETDRRFDGPSFIGGIVFALGFTAIGFVAWKFYKARNERNYHTL